MTPECSLTVHQLLTFYLEAGIDCALVDDPVDRLSVEDVAPARLVPAARAADNAPLSALASMKPGASDKPRPIIKVEVSPDIAIGAADELAKSATTLDGLRAALAAFDGCTLKPTATQLVFADGNPLAKIMFVGEAPDRDEDIEGRPFMGQTGKLFDLMLAAIGLNRTNTYLANVIPWRPPGNRTPTPVETKTCLPFIRRQIELVNPDVLVVLGNSPCQSLLGSRDGIMKAHGRWTEYDTGTRKIRAVATFHPLHLLQHPSYKRMAWQDLQAIAKVLQEVTAAPEAVLPTPGE